MAETEGKIMDLTEEQRGALARAIDYIDKTDLPVGKLDGFDREVLRNMVTAAINHGPDVMKMIELLAAGEHDQWAAWAQSILDSEPGLSEGRKAAWPGMIATPYENLSEELKDKDRREVHLRSSVALDIVQQQAARIKELESSLDEAEALTKKNAELMNGYLGRIAELEASWEEMCNRIQAEATESQKWKERAMALEDALAEERARGNHYGISYEEVVQPDGEIERWIIDGEKDLPKFYLDRVRAEARRQLKEEGKIGPDATKPRSWQITKERKKTLIDSIELIELNNYYNDHTMFDLCNMLRAMREAGQ